MRNVHDITEITEITATTEITGITDPEDKKEKVVVDKEDVVEEETEMIEPCLLNKH